MRGVIITGSTSDWWIDTYKTGMTGPRGSMLPMDIHHISMGVMVCISMTVYNINLPQTPEIQPCWKPVRTLIS